MPIAPTMRNAVQRTLRIGTFARAAERPRESVTQQFFLEGERQEAEGWKGTPLVPDTATPDPEIDFESFDHIPRKHLFLKLATVGLVASAVAVGVLWSMKSSAFDGHVKDQVTRATIAVRAVFASPDRAIATEAAPSAVGPASVAAPPVAAPSSVDNRAATEKATGVSIAARAGNGEGRLGGDDSGGGSTPTDTVRVEVARADPRSGARPGEPYEQEARGRQSDRRPRQPSRSVDDPVPSHNAGDRPEALRGYVWSPSAKALVPVGSDLPTTPSDPAGNPPAPDVRGVAVPGGTTIGEPGAVPAQP